MNWQLLGVCATLALFFWSCWMILTGRVGVSSAEQSLIDAVNERKRLKRGCQVPPKGWFCTRVPGHAGPCAAYDENTHQKCPRAEPQSRSVNGACAASSDLT